MVFLPILYSKMDYFYVSFKNYLIDLFEQQLFHEGLFYLSQKKNALLMIFVKVQQKKDGWVYSTSLVHVVP